MGQSRIKYIIVLFSILICIVLCEIILRFVKPHQIAKTGNQFYFYMFDSVYGWKGKPNIEGVLSRHGEYRVKVRNNSDGMRDSEYSAVNETGKLRRIVFMGDSYTWGFGVEHEEIYMEILERKFMRNSEVFNIALSGYSTLQSFLLLKDMHKKYHFDQAVLFFNTGDIYRNILDSQNGYGRPYAYDKDGELSINNLPVKRTVSLLSSLTSHSYLRRLLSLAKMKLTGKTIDTNTLTNKENNYGFVIGDIANRHINDGRNNYAFEVTRKLLRKIKDFCLEQGITFIVMLNTCSWQLDENFQKRALDAYKGDKNLIDWDMPQKRLESILSSLF